MNLTSTHAPRSVDTGKWQLKYTPCLIQVTDNAHITQCWYRQMTINTHIVLMQVTDNQHTHSSWNPFLCKTSTYLFYIFNIVAVGSLATQGASASATMMFTLLNRINSVPARKGLTYTHRRPIGRLLYMVDQALQILDDYGRHFLHKMNNKFIDIESHEPLLWLLNWKLCTQFHIFHMR